jgi:hypothetical protein
MPPCLARVLRKVPDMLESFADQVHDLLLDRDHGVLLAGKRAARVSGPHWGGWMRTAPTSQRPARRAQLPGRP